MKILFIRFSSIGDIVLTTPVVRCTRAKFPDAEIHFLTKKSFVPILESNPHINAVYGLEGDIQPVLLQLIANRYDVIIDLHKSLRSRYVRSILTQVFNSSIQIYSFNKLNLKKWLLVNFKINQLPDKSIVERYFEGVRSLGVINDGQGLDFYIDPEHQLKKDDLPLSHSQGYVVCSIGGQHATKKMPIKKWQSLCSTIPYPLIIVGGKEDAEDGQNLSALDPVRIYNACGKFSIPESAEIIRRAKLVITHDTGMMHIAAAFKKTIISIWGNTVPELGMFPYYGYNNLKTNRAPELTIIESEVGCRPCSKIGYSACPKKHFNCMEGINILAIEKKVAEVLHLKETLHP